MHFSETTCQEITKLWLLNINLKSNHSTKMNAKRASKVFGVTFLVLVLRAVTNLRTNGSNSNPRPRCKLQDVDVVYTWVNGSDPAFIESLKKWSGVLGEKHSVATSNVRFRDWETLKYSIRSFETYAPWIRNVYVVTNGQIPVWLNVSHPRVKLIKHQDIFPDLKHLPTFNSNAIELHLHRIQGLSEKFIYSNDDMLLGRPVEMEDFCHGYNGHVFVQDWLVPECYSGCRVAWVKDGTCQSICNNPSCNFDGGDCKSSSFESPVIDNDFSDRKDYLWGKQLVHWTAKLNAFYGYKERKILRHVPVMLDKIVLGQMTSFFEEEATETSSSRFRSPTDFQLQFCYSNYVIGEWILRPIRQPNDTDLIRFNHREDDGEDAAYIYLDNHLFSLRFELFKLKWFPSTFMCFADHNDDNQDQVDQVHEALTEYLIWKYPQKSQFEL